MFYFSEDQEKTGFRRIAQFFYEKNFGATSKAEIELLMFDIFMDALIDQHKDPTTGVLDYNACSDYQIGKMLGIPQERVRALKIKKQARYPVVFDWKESLLSIKDNVYFNKQSQRIIIPVRDPSLYNEIRNFIEDCGGYIEIQRGSNVIQIRPTYYFMLFYENLSDQEQEKCRKALEKELKRDSKDLEIPSLQSKRDTLNHILGIAENVTGIIGNVMSSFSGNPLAIVYSSIHFD